MDIINKFESAVFRTELSSERYYASVFASQSVGPFASLYESLTAAFWDKVRVVGHLADSLGATKKQLFYTVAEVSIPHLPLNNLRSAHGIALALSEIGELLTAVEKNDVVNIKEEIGDMLYGLTVLADAHGITLAECMEANMRKLSLRYPDGFSVEKFDNRNLDGEREELEK